MSARLFHCANTCSFACGQLLNAPRNSSGSSKQICVIVRDPTDAKVDLRLRLTSRKIMSHVQPRRFPLSPDCDNSWVGGLPGFIGNGTRRENGNFIHHS